MNTKYTETEPMTVLKARLKANREATKQKRADLYEKLKNDDRILTTESREAKERLWIKYRADYLAAEIK